MPIIAAFAWVPVQVTRATARSYRRPAIGWTSANCAERKALQSWPRESEHRDKWKLCFVTAPAERCHRRAEHEQKTQAEPLSGIQGQGGG